MMLYKLLLAVVSAQGNGWCELGKSYRNSICCDAGCGTCGGKGCESRPGGSSLCCAFSIKNSNKVCENLQSTNCIIPQDGTPCCLDVNGICVQNQPTHTGAKTFCNDSESRCLSQDCKGNFPEIIDKWYTSPQRNARFLKIDLQTKHLRILWRAWRKYFRWRKRELEIALEFRWRMWVLVCKRSVRSEFRLSEV